MDRLHFNTRISYKPQSHRQIHSPESVAGCDELDHYKLTGHAVLMGNKKLETQNTTAILDRFGATTRQAQLHYRQFVSDGIAAGNREMILSIVALNAVRENELPTNIKATMIGSTSSSLEFR
jgi:hypothetical protein